MFEINNLTLERDRVPFVLHKNYNELTTKDPIT